MTEEEYQEHISPKPMAEGQYNLSFSIVEEKNHREESTEYSFRFFSPEYLFKYKNGRVIFSTPGG